MLNTLVDLLTSCVVFLYIWRPTSLRTTPGRRMSRRTVSTRRRPADPEETADEHGQVPQNINNEEVIQRMGTVESNLGSITHQLGELVAHLNTHSLQDTQKYNTLTQRMNAVESDIGVIKDQLGEMLSRLNNTALHRVGPAADQLVSRHSRQMPPAEDLPPISSQLPRPTTFDGSMPWEEYHTQFAIIANANKWSDREMGEHLVASLSGAPLAVVHNLPKEHQISFEKLAEAFQIRFGSEHLTSLQFSQLQVRRQRNCETLAELATDVERLTRGAFPDCPPEAVERIAVRSFIQAIKDVKLKSMVSITSPKSVRAALLKAQKFEAENPTASRNFEERTSPVCYECKAVGHVRKECPNRKRSEN